MNSLEITPMITNGIYQNKASLSVAYAYHIASILIEYQWEGHDWMSTSS